MQDFYLYLIKAHNHFVCRDVFLALNEVLYWTYRSNKWGKNIHAIVKVEQSCKCGMIIISFPTLETL